MHACLEPLKDALSYVVGATLIPIRNNKSILLASQSRL